MGRDNQCNNLMDIINVLSFAMGIVNYNENVDQSTLQDTAQKIMQDIHSHLKMQDEKIDLIIDKLNKEDL